MRVSLICKIFLIVAIVLCLSALVLGLIFAIYIEKNISKTVDESIYATIGMGSSTKIYYYEFEDRENRIGTPLEISDKELYSAYRCKSVSYDKLPEDLINAFVSIEDKRFWEHSGVDFKRTVLASFNYFLNFKSSFGGSTITQQLIKNVTSNDEYSFQRKLQEIFWALDLEKKFDKQEILLMYLNIINLSQGCFGVGAASEYYFSKDVSELSLAECACIAAITNSPTYYNPIRNPENNKARRTLILSEMLDQGYISLEEYEKAVSEEIVLTPPDTVSTSNINSWYVDMVIDDVINDLVNKEGYSRSMANILIYTGGLKIYTALDPDVQATLEEYYSNTDFFPSSHAENPLQSSMIVIDPKTGDILGVVGSIGKKSANRVQNFATQTLRPAGSVIKPLSVYAPALEAGIINWATVYDDVPVNFGKYNLDANKGKIVDPVPWPKNSNGIYRGLTNTNYAISHSINTVTVKILEDIGLENSFDFLYNKLNIKSIISSKTLPDGSTISDIDYAALALGQFNYGATLREITAAYSIFANKGIYNNYRSYYKVTDFEDNVILENNYHGEAVLSEENASIMTLMLKNVLSSGTATDISLRYKVDTAGKTGTTQNNYDKWFIGYTPDYICGVWLGYEYPQSLDNSATDACHRIWNDVMTKLQKDRSKSFEISKNIVKAGYCKDSGKLISEACKLDPRGSRVEYGYFVKGNEPSKYCDIHTTVNYDIQYNGVACPECPPENVVQISLIKVNRSFPVQIYVTDAQYTWQKLGNGILPETSSQLPFYSNILKNNEYSGISRVSEQYNRYCRDHFDYFLWKEKNQN